jgi:hypothetical protein
MNYFAILWYLFLFGSSYLIYLLYHTIDDTKVSSLIESQDWFERIWIFPFYIFSELCYYILNQWGLYKDKQLLEKLEKEEIFDSFDDVAVIIPCHNAVEEIKKNREKLVLKFRYIFIADNSDSDSENEEFRDFCMEYGLYYRYYPIANKTNAILETAMYIKREFSFLNTIVLLDDDTIIQNDFFIRRDLLNEPTTAGYTCCIGINKSKDFNIWEHWIDFEYRTISYRNRSRNLHTLKFLHGIICVYKIDALIELFKWSVCNPGGLPFGEDAFAGIQARNIGYLLKQDHLNLVYTYCPKSLFNFFSGREQGYGASSLFKQRALRWYLSWPRRIFNEFGLLFYYDTGNWLGNIIYRFDFMWYLWIVMIACWWIGILIEMSFSVSTFANFCYIHFGFYFINALTSYIRIKTMSKKESENINWSVPFTFPLFLLVIMFLYSSSFIISLFYYIPFQRVHYKKCYNKVS